MRKLLGVLLAITLLMGTAPVMAAKSSEAAQLQSLGILKAEDTEFSSDGPVSRALFAALMVRLNNMESLVGTVNAPNQFTDVETGSMYEPYISVAKETGLMSGATATTFDPERAVTLEEAAKTIVSMLGYDKTANDRGGYPTGYMSVAAQLQLLSDVRAEEGLTGDALAMLISNSLDVQIMITDVNDPYYNGGYNTFRSRLTYLENVYKKRGIVTANSTVWTIQPRPVMSNTELEIDGVLYELDATVDPVAAASYLGMQVEFYVKETKDDDYIIMSIVALDKNKTLDLTYEDYIGMDGRGLRYQTESGRSGTAVLSDDAVVLKNGRPLSQYNENDFKIRNGSIRLIDHNSDNRYEYVQIDEYVDVIADRISGSSIFFRTGFTFEGKASFVVDDTTDEILYEFFDEKGNAAKISDIEKDDVLSILKGADGSYYRIVISSNTVEGTVTASNKDGYVIDGQQYDTSVDYSGDSNLMGSYVTGYLNYMGELVRIKISSQATQFGYVESVSKDQGSGQVTVKLIQAGTIESEIEVDDSSEDNVVENPILKCSNTGLLYFTTEGDLKVNSSKMSYEKAVEYFQTDANRVVEYKTDAEGKLTNLRTLETKVTGLYKMYNAYEKIFGALGNSSFAIDDNTKSVCVPEVATNNKEDYLVKLELNNNQKYAAVGYEINTDTQIAKLVVVTMPMNAQTSITEKNTALATDVLTAIDDNGETKTKVTYYLAGEEKTAYVSDNANAAAKALKKGDVFNYSTDAFQDILNVTLIESLSPEPAYMSKTILSYEKAYGYVADVKYNQISYLNNRWVTEVTLGLAENGATTRTFEINNRNTPDIYVYENNEFSIGSIDSIEMSAESDSDRVFIYQETATQKKECIVVIK